MREWREFFVTFYKLATNFTIFDKLRKIWQSIKYRWQNICEI